MEKMKTCEGSTAVDETDALACCKVIETSSEKEAQQFQRRHSEFNSVVLVFLCVCVYVNYTVLKNMQINCFFYKHLPSVDTMTQSCMVTFCSLQTPLFEKLKQVRI